MHKVLLAVQYITIFVLFIESWIVFRKMKSSLHAYLFFSCIAALVNNIGYLLEICSKNQDAYIIALKISYAGRIWIIFSLFLFVAELCKIKLPFILKNILIVFNLITYALILTFEKHHLYYTSFSFELTGLFPKVTHGNGIIHHIFMIQQFLYIIIGLSMLFISCYKERNKTAKRRLITVITAFILESLFFALQLIGIKGLKGVYDLSMLGYFIGTFFMFIAIFRFDLLGTKEIAREFMIDRLSEGVIATDNDGIIQYYNDPAKALFPELQLGSEEIPQEVLNVISNGGHFNINDRIYTTKETELKHLDKSFGKIYALIDETEHFRYMKELEAQEIQRVEMEAMKNQIRMGNETIFAIANAVEARDKNTGRHSYRVSEYAVTIAAELGFSPDEQEQLRKTGLLHDIGKIGVPDSILNKPAKLTDEEYAVMKTHTVIGGEILKDFTLIPHVDEGAKFHHERYDGNGYPTGLKGEEIPLNARIIGIADAFDAMTANRVYRKALDISFVKEELKRCSGTQFDPKLTEILLSLLESGKINPAKTVKENG